MKTGLSLLAFFFGIVTLPITIFSSYLLYQHIQATDLMWFLWWMIVPLTILTTLCAKIAEHLAKD